MMQDFPQPSRLGGSTRWAPLELHDWEERHKLKLPELTGMVSVRQLAKRYGVSIQTIWRWAQESRKGAEG